MATWRAEVFVNSRVGRISTEVEAATFSGAKEQIYAKHGDVQQIVNLRQVSSGGSSSSGVFAVAGEEQGRALWSSQRVGAGEHALGLVAERMAAEFVGGAPEGFALAVLHGTDAGVSREAVATVDQRGHQHTATVGREAACELVVLGDAGSQTGDLLGRDVAVG